MALVAPCPVLSLMVLTLTTWQLLSYWVLPLLYEAGDFVLSCCCHVWKDSPAFSQDSCSDYMRRCSYSLS